MRVHPFVLCFALLAACEGDDDKTPTGDDDDDDTVGDTSDTETDTPPTPTADTSDTTVESTPPDVPVFTSAPTLRQNPAAGLTRYLDATLDRPARLDVTVEIDTMSWTVTSPESETHALLLLGLRPDRDFAVRVVATDAAGLSTEEVVLLGHSEPPPADMLLPVLGSADPTRMEPGVTLFSSADGYTVMVDADGVPCWWAVTPNAGHEIRMWTDGTVSLVANRSRFDRLGLDGTLLQRFTAEFYDGPIEPVNVAVDALALHHDFVPMPNGNVLALTVERRFVPFRTSEADPLAPFADAWVAGDVVVELDGTTGAVVDEWPLFDLMDTERVAWDSVRGDYWHNFGDWRGDETKDWLHANSVDYDPATDTIMVSMRHQDAVIGIDRASNTLAWIVGPTANWRSPWAELVLDPPAGAEFTNYHQHSAKFTPQGTIIMFDNGNRRASAFEAPLPEADVYSRGYEIRLDLPNHTYDVVWEWHNEPGPYLFSGSLSSADALPQTGNRLLVYGNLRIGQNVARMLELRPDGTGVWDLQLPDRGAWFRAHRVTGVIPGPGR